MWFFRRKKGSDGLVTAKILHDVASGNTLLLDVRTLDEYEREHAKNSVNVPFLMLHKLKNRNFHKNKMIYVYCAAGGRSNRAVEILHNAGYKNVFDIKSLEFWKMAGGEVETILKR